MTGGKGKAHIDSIGGSDFTAFGGSSAVRLIATPSRKTV